MLRSLAVLLPVVAIALAPAACSTSDSTPAGPSQDAAIELPPSDPSCAGPCPKSNIKHVVIVIQENHTFDNHFGAYCKATAGSNPTCNAGPDCCEAAPATDPSGNKPIVLDDDAMGGRDPDHTSACETTEMNGGAMDMYASAKCGSPTNVAVAPAALVQPYWDFAANGAIADRYFQPLIGQSSANDMYFARAAFVFDDNSFGPQGAIGLGCGLSAPPKQFPDKTIGDLLSAASVPWTFYAEGYKAMGDAVASGTCPDTPDDCPAHLRFYPCLFDPSDVPFEYYASSVDNAQTMKDRGSFDDALANGGLPAVSFVKSIGYKSEHPGYHDLLSAGVTFASGVANAVLASRYRDDTLVIITYDEGGGYYDHVAPPPTSTVDNKPYGTRVPFIAIGPFAKKNFVSHVVMEHSSVVKFIEWNFLGGVTGQLMTRDATVNNIGSVLDPATTGVAVPEQ